MQVTMTAGVISEFCRQWPCHGFPDTLNSITFDFAGNGDLVDIIALDDEGNVVDSATFDGPALAAFAGDAKRIGGA